MIYHRQVFQPIDAGNTKEEIELSHNQIIQFVTGIVNKDLEILESVIHENLTYFDTKSK